MLYINLRTSAHLRERLGATGRLIAEMRGGVDEDTEPQDLTNKHMVALHQLLHEAKFKDPDKDHLSPAGASFLPSCPTECTFHLCAARLASWVAASRAAVRGAACAAPLAPHWPVCYREGFLHGVAMHLWLSQTPACMHWPAAWRPSIKGAE